MDLSANKQNARNRILFFFTPICYGIHMGAGQAIKQVAQDVGGQLADVAASAVKQTARTPLDILEDMLGGPAGNNPGQQEKGMQDKESGQNNPGDDPAQKAQLQQKIQEEQKQRAHKLQFHQAAMEREKGFFEQQQQVKQQQKEMMKEQEEKQKDFQIDQLKREKSQNLQVQMAKDQSNAEKRMGAG